MPPLRILIIMWGIYLLGALLGLDLGFLGIYPRTVGGLAGILFAPLLHDSARHIISNSVPFLVLGHVVYFFYGRIAPQVFLAAYFLTNLLVWIVGRASYHIGASGLVYALASFLIFYGLFKRDFKSLIISITVISFYGGLVYGVFPTGGFISWESHLMGSIVGIGMAYNHSKTNTK